MNDLISRQAAIDALGTLFDDVSKDNELKGVSRFGALWGIANAIGVISHSTPTANQKSTWINYIERGMCECKICGEMIETERAHKANFCPNCGADMRERRTDG